MVLGPHIGLTIDTPREATMNIRCRSLRFVAMAIVSALPLVGTSAVATAKVAEGCRRARTGKAPGSVAGTRVLR